MRTRIPSILFVGCVSHCSVFLPFSHPFHTDSASPRKSSLTAHEKSRQIKLVQHSASRSLSLSSSVKSSHAKHVLLTHSLNRCHQCCRQRRFTFKLCCAAFRLLSCWFTERLNINEWKSFSLNIHCCSRCQTWKTWKWQNFKITWKCQQQLSQSVMRLIVNNPQTCSSSSSWLDGEYFFHNSPKTEMSPRSCKTTNKASP